jgi:hypothetical protein
VYPEKPGEPRIAPLGSQNGFGKPFDRLQRPHRVAVEVIWQAEVNQIAGHQDRRISHDGPERGHMAPAARDSVLGSLL